MAFLERSEPSKSEKTEKELKDIEDETKPKEKPWYKTVPPVILIGAGVLIFLAYQSMQKSKDTNNNNYVILIAIVLIIMYLLSKNQPEQERLVTPEEAELLVMKELRRKLVWEQMPEHTKVKITYVNNLIHRNSKPQYYIVGAQIIKPYQKYPINLLAKVMPSGPERGFVSIVESVNNLSGREIPDVKVMFPELFNMARGDPLMQKMLGRGMR